MSSQSSTLGMQVSQQAPRIKQHQGAPCQDLLLTSYLHTPEKTYLDAGSPWGNAEGTRKSLTTELSVPDMIKGRLTASRRRSMVASRPTTSSRSRTPTVQNKDYGRLSPPPDDDVEIKQELDLTSDQMKEALQRSAYDAVLSNNSKEWCLVSVDGHNTKESEL